MVDFDVLKDSVRPALVECAPQRVAMLDSFLEAGSCVQAHVLGYSLSRKDRFWDVRDKRLIVLKEFDHSVHAWSVAYYDLEGNFLSNDSLLAAQLGSDLMRCRLVPSEHIERLLSVLGDALAYGNSSDKTG